MIFTTDLGRPEAPLLLPVGSWLDDAEWTASGIRGPDGMAFAADGRLFVTASGHGDLAVLGTNGGPVERIPMLGKASANVAFGRPGGRCIYVAEDEHGQMEVHDVGVDGLEHYD